MEIAKPTAACKLYLALAAIGLDMAKELFCPVHGSDAQESYGMRSGYQLRRCRNCGLVYLARQENPVNLDFYKDASARSSDEQNRDKIEYWSLPNYYARHRDVFDSFFHERIMRIRSDAPHAQSLLDIGCGYGFFLKYAQKFFNKVAGVELDPAVAGYAKKEGLPVHNRSAESLLGEQSFDCIVLCDVLEHLQNPLQILNLCNEIINPGGIIYVQVPNLLGFKLPWGHSWGLPHHIWQFGKSSLGEMLKTAGFSCVRHKTGVLGVVGVLENGGPGWLKQLEWKAARLSGFGNRLQTTAIKR